MAKPLFLTHTPALTFAAGKEWVDSSGRRFIMTELRSIPPTALYDGGRAPCWEVYGEASSR